MERKFEDYYPPEEYPILRSRTERSPMAKEVGEEIRRFLAHLRQLLDIHQRDGLPAGFSRVIEEQLALRDRSYLNLRLEQIESLESILPILFDVEPIRGIDKYRLPGFPPFEYNPRAVGLAAFSPEMPEMPFAWRIRKYLNVQLGREGRVNFERRRVSKMRTLLYPDSRVGLSFYSTCLTGSDGMVWCFISGGRGAVHHQRMVLVPPGAMLLKSVP